MPDSSDFGPGITTYKKHGKENRAMAGNQKLALSPISLRHWRTFHAVHDYGSLSEAAAQLHVTQPSVCYTMGRLEEHFGVPLYRVVGRKIVVTEPGKMLLDRSRKLLNEAANLEHFAQDLSGMLGQSLTVIVENAFPCSALDKSMASFRTAHPEVPLIVDSVGAMNFPSSLAERPDHCLAIGTRIPEGYAGDLLCDLDYLPVVHASHPLSKDAAVQGGMLDGVAQLVVSKTKLSGQALRIEPEAGENGELVVNSIEDVIEALERYAAYAWIPACLLAISPQRHQLRVLHLHDSSIRRMRFYLVRKSDTFVSPLLAALAGEVMAAFRPVPAC
jgi:DNA-binding transcriptional LysR family regulator